MNIFSEKTAKILSWVGLLVIVVSAIVFIIFRSWNFTWMIDEEKIGQFGDFIGGVVGCLLAFVGVILYYVALTEQRKDIEINRETLETQIKALNQQIEEFKAQTKEMQDTRTVYEEQTNLYREQTEYYKQQVKELKNQTKISSLQHFNSEFYNLLNVFINIKKDCIVAMKKVIDALRNTEFVPNRNTICDKHKCLIEEYVKHYNTNSDSLFIYFKTIYRLLKMIDQSNIEEGHKQRYAKTVRSQLSEIDLLILYYDYYSELGEKGRLEAVKYGLLKHLNMVDKIEFGTNAFRRHKTPIISFFNELSLLFDSKICEYLDIENENDIDVENNIDLVGIRLKYVLKIYDDIIVFKIDTNQQNMFSSKDVEQLFLMYLYEYFFFRKFKEPTKNTFTISHESNTDYIYTAKLTNIL